MHKALTSGSFRDPDFLWTHEGAEKRCLYSLCSCKIHRREGKKWSKIDLSRKEGFSEEGSVV